ncbi:hydroxymethylglutaryl-CoA lyase [Sinorhizobium sp. BG8]|uniref:hydroxymethylglutaryl-CoA lyase n=1 Tax=Sinorhizobium sp. BG8 TaxID=2613773 RepID=UPI00193EC015|nr:hydroxymethylglutaryl-CoA lyase [Sinorhizobium sp. BG8]QRM53827.1 hydroxymethylglutaryl-CoA lyase [Sinorhizobium sp. BG8]
MSEFVEIVEMAARDGLQNEKRIIPVSEKVALIDLLSVCGYRRIEAASFVSPKWVPQLADGAEVMAEIRRREGVKFVALVPNMQGYKAARAAKADAVAIFVSASEGFSHANINCSIAESLERLAPVAKAARRKKMPLRGYVSCVVSCPYDGPTPPAAVAKITESLFALGCAEVSLGDTIGHGKPEEVSAMLDAVLDVAPPERLAGHYHDTGGRALDNIRVSLEKGIRVFDASIGGLGGCPYAPGAKGNVDTGAVLAMLEQMGFETGLDRGAVEAVGAFARQILRKEEGEKVE